MMAFRSKWILLLCASMLLLSACSTRGIPAIQHDKWNQKLAVLVITEASLNDSGKQSINKALHGWRDTEKITYEWIKDVNALDDSLLTKAKNGTYDYIYVIGNNLIQTAAKEATLDANSKWTLLPNNWNPQQATVGQTHSIAQFDIDPALIDGLKDNWVKQQADQNVQLEWVTRAASPIPSAWAPSEEADHIVLLDNNDQWLQQLGLQIRQHASKWIVFNSTEDPAVLQKAKTLGVSVMNFTAISVDFNWDLIMSNQLNTMKQNSWKSGLQAYSQQELQNIQMMVK
jgi:hypothetical protein